MADPNHSYSRTPNTLPELEGTMRGVYHSRGIVTNDELMQQTAKANPDIGSPDKVKMVMSAMMGKVADHVSQNRRVQMQGVGITFGVGLGGSLPTLDADPGEDNPLYTGIYLDENWRAPFDGIVPELVGPAADKPVAYSVEDERSHRGGVVVGTDTFHFIGANLSVNAEGECLTLTDSTGATHVAVVTEVKFCQRVYAHFTEAPAPGKAKMTLLTRGSLTPHGSLWPLTKQVTVLAGDAPVPPGDGPEITNGYSNGHIDDPGKAYGGDGFMLEGSRFGDDAALVSVKIGYTLSGQHRESEVAPEEMAVNDTYIEIYDSSVALMAALGAGGTITFTVETDAGISNVYTAQVVS